MIDANAGYPQGHTQPQRSSRRSFVMYKLYFTTPRMAHSLSMSYITTLIPFDPSLIISPTFRVLGLESLSPYKISDTVLWPLKLE